MSKPKAKNKIPTSEIGETPIHDYFGLSYCGYQVLPRSIMQSMPVAWQKKFVPLMREVDAKCEEHGIEAGPYDVYCRDARGRIEADPYGNYQRGRRNVFKEKENRNG